MYNTKRIGGDISAYPGISYAVTRKFHLETGFNNLLYINYTNEKGGYYNGFQGKYETNSFNIGSSINNMSSIYLGFRLLIGK